MKRVVFYFYGEKAFGSIHYELCKYLFAEGADAVLLQWNVGYSYDEILELDEVTDVWVTNPDGYHTFVDSYGVNPEKIVIVAHGPLDLHQLIAAKGTDGFDQPKGYAVVSNYLKKESKRLGIKRIPELLPLGINVNRYSVQPSKTLETVGYAGVFYRKDDHDKDDWKRGYLAERCAQLAGLQFKVAETYHNSYITMAGFYTAVDCIIVASSEEGACLPMLEAGAAGRLVISTPVGHWKELVGEKGSLKVPIKEDEFVAETTKLLQYYKDNPKAYQQKCQQIQEHAQSYDWKNTINKWKKFIVG